ncbi:MAG: glycerophosphodiester phosphodiesterase family protein [Thermoleophilaceae bacterium]
MLDVPALSRPAHLPPLKRVGHKGADHVAPGNTLESFERALAMGVDMIEFDVLRTHDGRLVLAHDPEDARARDPLSLDEGLDHFARAPYADVELDVDLKSPGYEREVADGLSSRGLLDRTLVSTTYPESLDLLGAIAPGLRRGWSVPRARRDYTRSLLAPLAYALLRVMRARLPARASGLMRAGRCEAVMAHWLLVSPTLVERVHAAGGQVYVWTVDDARRIARLEALGVDGVITNDPRLFDAAARSVMEGDALDPAEGR